MEASALQAPAALAHRRVAIGLPWLRLRSDDQLVALFRAGNEEAFSVIHDRYRQRLFAYARQMLPGPRQDAEDALQDVFVRAYGGLRANDRQLALRAWLYRVAHNRCIDELRRPPLPSPELLEVSRPPTADPPAIAEQRETLRRLIADVRRLPEQQRSALLMRELSDMSYAELAQALDVSVPAVKSLLVRARIGLARAADARDTACSQIREELTLAHDRGVRPTGTARRHLRDCDGCREFRREVRGLRRQLAALTPVLGPVGVVAKLVGGGAGSGAAGGVAVAGGAGGAVTAGGLLAGSASHIAALMAAAVITAGGAVELQNTLIPAAAGHHAARHAAHPARAVARAAGAETVARSPAGSAPSAAGAATAAAGAVGPAGVAGNAGSGAASDLAGSQTGIAPERRRGGAPGATFDLTAPPSAYLPLAPGDGSAGTGSGPGSVGSSISGTGTGASGSTTGGDSSGGLLGLLTGGGSSSGPPGASAGSGTTSSTGGGSTGGGAAGGAAGGSSSPTGPGAISGASSSTGAGPSGGTTPAPSGYGGSGTPVGTRGGGGAPSGGATLPS